MASPSTADEAPGGDATPLPGTGQVAAGLHARRTRIIDTPRMRVLEGIGDVGRAARRFSALTGLSLSARRALQAQRSDVGRQPVRPPDFWTGYQEEEEERLSGRGSTGDAALDRLIARRATKKREATARPRVQRGLPSTIHRRSHSVAGPMTAPGGMARRLLPATVVPAPNPANSPQTAASREPRTPRPARPGQRDRDRPRPAAPPAPSSTVARRAADRAAAPTDRLARPAGPDSSGSTTSTSPSGRAVTGAPPSPAAGPVGASTGAGPAATQAGGPSSSAASSVAVRRSAAPSELDPGAGGGPAWVGVPAASGREQAASTPGAAGSPVGATATGSDPAVARSSGSRSSAPDAVVARAAVDQSTEPWADAGPARPGTAVARAAVDDRSAGSWNESWADAAPAWPGDLPDGAGSAPSPFAAASVGRQVAVRPLLAGWRAPTAWRSIAAAPGLRLLPVGPAGLPTSWSSTTTGADEPTGSWADTVRRAVRESSTGPGSVRNLPVGGPTVVVREAAPGQEGAVARRAAGVERGPASRSNDAAASRTSTTRSGARAATSSGSGDRAGSSPSGAGRASNAGSATTPSSGGVRPGREAALGSRTSVTAAAAAGSTPGSAAGARISPSGDAGTDARRAAGAGSSIASRRTATPDTWSPLGAGVRVAGPAGNPIFLRRHVTASSSGSAVELTAWTLPPGLAGTSGAASMASVGSATASRASSSGRGGSSTPGSTSATSSPFGATIRRTPGFRPADARRPGAWLGRAAAAGPSGSLAAGVHRVPMGPLGPVRWSARADEPVVARSASPAPSWSAQVAAAAAVMGGTASLTGSAIRPPVAGGLTLVRGGRADGSDLPVPSIQRSSTHPAATRLQLVPPVGEATAGPASVRRSSSAEVARATSSSTDPSAAPAAYVGRAPVGSTPFVSIPGAVAAHGLPAARASLVGVTASGPAAGGVATPGVLGRLVHGEPVRRRLALDLAPPALVSRSGATALAAVAPSVRGDRPGLPVTPAALVRRRQAEQQPAVASPGRVGHAGATWAQRVAAAAGTGGSPAALAALMAAGPTAPSWAQRVSVEPGRAPTAPSARRADGDARSATSPTLRRRTSDPTGTAVSPAARATAGSPAARATAGAASAAPTWAQRVAAAGEGRYVPAAPTTASIAPTWAQRVAAAGEGRALPAPSSTSTTAPGWLLAPPVYATGGASVASLRGLPVAPAAFGIVRSADGSPAVGGRTTTSSSGPASGAARAEVGATVHRSRTPHGVSATVARRLRERRPGLVADRWRGADVPARALPGRAPSALRPILAPEVIRRTPIRPSAPGAASRFDEVLRSADAPVRPVALPVRFRPLAERIIGRMPVQIATGVASRRALAAVGTTAATTGSVIHLPAAPDGSARMAGILAHELTHVAAASPVARFHGGHPSIEETAATQVERIVARAARTSGSGRGPASPGTSGLPVGGFVGVKGATAGPPAPASVASSSSPAIGGGSSSSGGGSGTVQRVVAQSEAAPPARRTRAADRIRRRQAPGASTAPLESAQEAADESTVLSDDALDAIVRALEARLLESIERRGGLWRGGF